LFGAILYIVCVYMCTELLPPGGYPIAVKYIISYYTIDSLLRRNKGHVNFWYHQPIILANQHLFYYQNEHNTQNTMHASMFYNIFRPFVLAMLRPFVVGHDG